ncbi:class I SAM-dependent methyltransferase [Candidatus Parcubacteria bacterium]|nr:MAG: class I SAM-dependent methyltransferase [Candidatus Parcubacteria bacterium]
MTKFEDKQREHYDDIIYDYDAHYNEKYSNKYRDKFLYKPLFSGIDWQGKKVLEGMCGTGSTTGYLRDKGAQVTGLDISPKAIELFKTKWPGSEAVCASMTESNLPGDSFDIIVIDGGLHHLHPHLNEALTEIHRLLKPGGLFFFLEPHTASFFDKLRKIWYKMDSLFEENEAAVDLEKMKSDFKDRFIFNKEIYVGGPAFMFVFNSMVFRVPPKLKFLYSDFFIFLDTIIKPLINKYNSFKVLGAWQKKYE